MYSKGVYAPYDVKQGGPSFKKTLVLELSLAFKNTDLGLIVYITSYPNPWLKFKPTLQQNQGFYFFVILTLKNKNKAFQNLGLTKPQSQIQGLKMQTQVKHNRTSEPRFIISNLPYTQGLFFCDSALQVQIVMILDYMF